MSTEKYWRLLMLLSPLHEGGHVDVSSHGYAEMATEFEEVHLDSFDNYTFGQTSQTITIIEVSDNHSVICRLDDDSTQCIITADEQEYLLDFKESIYNEFIKRLKKQRERGLKENEYPELDWSTFAVMVKQKPFTLKPFVLAGYFEHPSTIEDSKAELSSVLEETEADDEDE